MFCTFHHQGNRLEVVETETRSRDTCGTVSRGTKRRAISQFLIYLSAQQPRTNAIVADGSGLWFNLQKRAPNSVVPDVGSN